MRKILFLLCFVFSSVVCVSQELNAVVTINHSQIGNSNQAYFKTLETALAEFINNTRWTTKNVSSLEKIDCVFYLNVNSYEANAISGSLQVQSSRVVYNSTYNAPIFNFNDRDIGFSYTEFESLFYNPNSFDSNLTSIIAYYVNIILGVDADSFAEGGGTTYFQNASNIASLAQQSGYKGWKQGDGNNNRYFLVNDLLSSANKPFRDAIYEYHRKGLDEMADNLQKGKDGVYASLNTLAELHKNRPNAFLTRVFFDAKTEEIVSIYSGVMDSNKKKVIEVLNKISPLNASKWNNL